MNYTKESVKKAMVFSKIAETEYKATIEDEIINMYISNIISDFSICGLNKFSSLMDISLGEELLARIVSDLFISSYENEVIKHEMGVIITIAIRGILYKISIARNDKALGGIVYGIMT